VAGRQFDRSHDTVAELIEKRNSSPSPDGGCRSDCHHPSPSCAMIRSAVTAGRSSPRRVVTGRAIVPTAGSVGRRRTRSGPDRVSRTASTGGRTRARHAWRGRVAGPPRRPLAIRDRSVSGRGPVVVLQQPAQPLPSPHLAFGELEHRRLARASGSGRLPRAWCGRSRLKCSTNSPTMCRRCFTRGAGFREAPNSGSSTPRVPDRPGVLTARGVSRVYSLKDGPPTVDAPRGEPNFARRPPNGSPRPR
jgi:hypothetical protein